MIGKLRTEDIYHQQKALPLPEHSTTAFAHQGAMLFIILFFVPNMLHNQSARMREIVDKFYPDNWVFISLIFKQFIMICNIRFIILFFQIVNIYMGITINLIEVWEPFKAARMALANTIETTNIQEYATIHAQNIEVSI